MNITVYCGSSRGADPRFVEAAHELGAWIGSQGHALVYGGSSIGLMGIVARTVMEAGGRAYGVEPRFFVDAGVAQCDLTELFVVESMPERKAKMIELGEAFVALPGGVGTLEEISEIMSLIRLGKTAAPCCFLNIGGYYDSLRAFVGTMLEQGFIAQDDFDRYLFPATVGECAAIIERAQSAPARPHATAAEMRGGARG